MINKHLTDGEIQQFALDNPLQGQDSFYLESLNTADETARHLAGCLTCQEQVAGYQALFTGLTTQEPAMFEFDLAAMVMDRMAEPAPKPRWVPVAFVILGLLGISVPILTVIKYHEALGGLFAGMLPLFTSLTPLILMLISTGVLTTLVLLLADMYKQYRKKLNLIEMN